MPVEFPPPGFTAVLVFDDKTPNNVILSRIVKHTFALAAHTNLSTQEMEDLRDLVILIARCSQFGSTCKRMRVRRID
jgi:hypothetical protein